MARAWAGGLFGGLLGGAEAAGGGGGKTLADFEAEDARGNKVALGKYVGKAVLVVNVASN
jgi:hypothetical protein